MSHQLVLRALERACPADLGFDDSIGTLLFLTDWHVVPGGTEDDWPAGRVCRHPPERLQKVIEELAQLEQDSQSHPSRAFRVSDTKLSAIFPSSGCGLR